MLLAQFEYSNIIKGDRLPHDKEYSIFCKISLRKAITAGFIFL